MTAATVRRIRRGLGLTQVGFAKQLGVHPMTVSKWERGTVPITGPVALSIRYLASVAPKPKQP